jgi:Immune inhibitor A peptidase M6
MCSHAERCGSRSRRSPRSIRCSAADIETAWLALHRRHPCTNTGSTGRWNSFTGNSGGWDQVAFDLSAYAGKQVEVSIAYVSDPGTGGNGLFIDDTRLTTTSGQVDAEDTVLLGFGAEQTGAAADRGQLLDRALAHLIG